MVPEAVAPLAPTLAARCLAVHPRHHEPRPFAQLLVIDWRLLRERMCRVYLSLCVQPICALISVNPSAPILTEELHTQIVTVLSEAAKKGEFCCLSLDACHRIVVR